MAGISDRRQAAGRIDDGIVYVSKAIQRVLDQAQQVGETAATVLLLGETGVGKELFAQAVHAASARRGRPMIRVSCAALPAALIERELFGNERGAYTGAVERQIGRFEAAHGSTLFLDEIGELPLEMQVKLLRVLQERTVERLGSNKAIKVDVRLIAATNRNLESAVAARSFREDLYYRVNVFPISIPPLRDRPEDIAPLACAFAEELAMDNRKTIEAIDRECMAELQHHAWPGNVRELRNVIERAVIQADGPILRPVVSRTTGSRAVATSERLLDVQTQHIKSVLDSCGWRIRGEGGAAVRLGVKPTTLEGRMNRLGLSRETAHLSVAN